MSDEVLIGNILHDLAGMMTSVQGLAQIVENKKDHPSRDEFLRMLSSEADKAATAVKDLQLLRALQEGSPVEDMQQVTISELYLAIREALSEDLRHGFAPPPPGVPDVLVDKDLLADLIARTYEVASQTNQSEDHHLRVAEAAGKVELTIDLGPPNEDMDVIDGVQSGRKGFRPVAIAQRLLPRWNGGVEPRADDREVQVVFRLDRAP